MSGGWPTGWGTPGSPGCWAEGLLLPTCVRHSCQAQWSYWGKGREISNLACSPQDSDIKVVGAGTSKRGLRCLRQMQVSLGAACSEKTDQKLGHLSVSFRIPQVPPCSDTTSSLAHPSSAPSTGTWHQRRE